MMEISEPRLRYLLRQADRVASSGKRAAAEQLYRQIVAEAPQAEAAWLGLAEVVTRAAEKEKAYEQVLKLDPSNETARSALAELRGRPIDEVTPDGDRHKDVFDQSRDWLEAATAPGQAAPAPEAATPPKTQPTPDPGPVDRATVTVPPGTAAEEEYELVCFRHPDRPTSLRCYSCGQAICSRCAVKTPVGYRCPVCIREAEAVFFTARPLDYILAVLVALPLSVLAGFLVSLFGRGFFFILIMLFVGGAIGGLIAGITSRVVGRRRGRYLPHVVAASVILGALVPALPYVLAVIFGNLAALTRLLIPGIYAFVAASAAFYRMK
ncbi:MAG TPA: hypothetical protein VF177_11340 [Anaerolineae bacterium]